MIKLMCLNLSLLTASYKAQAGQRKTPAAASHTAGGSSPHRDAVSGAAMKKQMNTPSDLLLGRKTFEIWEKFWPQHGDIWPGVNTATKYVASNTITSSEWQPSVFLNGNIADKITKIKQQEGPDLHVYGSAKSGSDAFQT